MQFLDDIQMSGKCRASVEDVGPAFTQHWSPRAQQSGGAYLGCALIMIYIYILVCAMAEFYVVFLYVCIHTSVFTIGGGLAGPPLNSAINILLLYIIYCEGGFKYTWF